MVYIQEKCFTLPVKCLNKPASACIGRRRSLESHRKYTISGSQTGRTRSTSLFTKGISPRPRLHEGRTVLEIPLSSAPAAAIHHDPRRSGGPGRFCRAGTECTIEVRVDRNKMGYQLSAFHDLYPNRIGSVSFYFFNNWLEASTPEIGTPPSREQY